MDTVLLDLINRVGWLVGIATVMFANLALKVPCVEVIQARSPSSAVSEKYLLSMQRSVTGIILIPVLGPIIPMQALAYGMASQRVQLARSQTLPLA